MKKKKSEEYITNYTRAMNEKLTPNNITNFSNIVIFVQNSTTSTADWENEQTFFKN
jgi:hypothetical protein